MTRTILLWSLAALAALAVVLRSWSRSQEAATELTSQRRAHEREVRALNELQALRTHLGPWVQNAWPSSDQSQREAGVPSSASLTARVHAVLPAAGLEPAVLVAVSPLGEQRVGNAGSLGPLEAVLERDAVTLAPVTLPRLGAVLSAWRQAEPGWRFAAIELAPLSSSSRATTSSDRDRPWRAVLTIESLHIRPAASAIRGGAP